MNKKVKIHQNLGLSKEEEGKLKGIYNIIAAYYQDNNSGNMSIELAKSIIRMSFIQGKLHRIENQNSFK